MSHERKQVLELLAAGKITAQEAERLLEKLDQSAAPTTEDASAGEAGAGSAVGGSAGGSAGSSAGRSAEEDPLPPIPPEPPRAPKFLRIVVDSTDGDKVNIRVPTSLIRTGIKLSTMLPENANDRLQEKGIDLSQLNGKEGEELLEALRELTVDVNSKDGERVRIYCE